MKKTTSRPQCEASLKQKRPQEGGMGGMGSLWDWVKHVIFWVLFQRMSWLWIVQTEKECIRIVPLAHWPQILTLPLKQRPHGSIKSSCIACKTKRWKSGLLPRTLHQGSCGKGASKRGCQWIDSRENLGESMALPQIWSISFFRFNTAWSGSSKTRSKIPETPKKNGWRLPQSSQDRTDIAPWSAGLVDVWLEPNQP